MSATQLLSGRLTIITGSAGGIGQSICKLFQKHGALVATLDHKCKIQQLDKEVYFIETDVAKSSDIESSFNEIYKQFNKIPSVLVNCAGITRDSLLLKMTDEQLESVLNVNLKGTILVTKEFAKRVISNSQQKPFLNNRPNGSVINLASVVGRTGNIGQCNYSASKAGVIGFTKSAALELARYNIRVNSILPGFIKTPMTEKINEKITNAILKTTPLQRFGEPDEVANVALFLASDMSSFITGASIDVNGGLHMH